MYNRFVAQQFPRSLSFVGWVNFFDAIKKINPTYRCLFSEQKYRIFGGKSDERIYDKSCILHIMSVAYIFCVFTGGDAGAKGGRKTTGDVGFCGGCG